MSLLKTIFKIPVKAQIGFLKLDASINETHNRTATVTDNEVEDGSVISDHIKLAPKSFTIQGQVSKNPVSILGIGVSTDDVLGAADEFVGGDKSAFEGLVKNQKRTPKEAWLYLEDLLERRTPFSAVTSLQRYENMVLTKLSAPRVAANGQDLVFTGELRYVKTVVSSITAVPSFKTDNDSATSKSKNGKQSGKEASGKQADDSSLLLKGFKKVGILQ